MAVNGPEDRPVLDGGPLEPLAHGAHRAGQWIRAERDAYLGAEAFLVGLGAAQLDHQSVEGMTKWGRSGCAEVRMNGLIRNREVGIAVAGGGELPDTLFHFTEPAEGLFRLAMPEAPLRTLKRRLHPSSDHRVQMLQSNQELPQSLQSHGQMKPVQHVLGARTEVPLE